MDEKDYILFTRENLYKMLVELEITVGSRMNSAMSVEAIEGKIDEHRQKFMAIQVWYPEFKTTRRNNETR